MTGDTAGRRAKQGLALGLESERQPEVGVPREAVEESEKELLGSLHVLVDGVDFVRRGWPQDLPNCRASSLMIPLPELEHSVRVQDSHDSHFRESSGWTELGPKVHCTADHEVYSLLSSSS